MNVIDLFGSISENFYQLGLKDRATYSEVMNHIKDIYRLPAGQLGNIVESSASAIIYQLTKRQGHFADYLHHYAEGLEISEDELFYPMLLPEAMSSMTSWLPNLSRVFGCSSYFALDHETGSPIHVRILDFPLAGSFDKNERIVRNLGADHKKMMTFSTSGFPFPSITTMTEGGITLAIHQKFSNIFEKEGRPIFEIIFDMLLEINTIEEAIDYLKNSTSITTWAINMTFPDKKALSFDIMGKKHTYEVYDLAPNEVIYLNNELIDEKLRESQPEFIPHGFSDYNQMRKNVALKKIATLKEGDFTCEKLLKAFSSPSKTSKDSRKFQLDPITPSSMQAISMQPKEAKACYIPEAAPKIYSGKITSLTKCFKKIQTKTIKKKEANIQYKEAMRELIHAQKSLDQKNEHELYDHMQMAIELSEGRPEQVIFEFFFIVIRSIFEPHEKIQLELIQSLKLVAPKLPLYLRNQAQLITDRLEYSIGKGRTFREEDFDHEALLHLLEKEKALPSIIFKNIYKYLVNPRMDLLDIITLL